jgi:hypothetical protein
VIRFIDLLSTALRFIAQYRVGLKAIRVPNPNEVYVSLPDLVPRSVGSDTQKPEIVSEGAPVARIRSPRTRGTVRSG